MKFLTTLFFLVSLVSLRSQTNQDRLCSSQCGDNEVCLCKCFLKKGQALREAEQYTDAIRHFQAAMLICDNEQVQAVIDSIQYHEQRIWIYEGGINGKFAIGNGLGELVEKDKPYNPYRFSNPEPFNNGIAMFSKNEIYYFIDRMGNELTPINGYRGVIQSEGNLNYFIGGEEVDYKHGINIYNGLHPVLWRNSYLIDETLHYIEMSPWEKIDSLVIFLEKFQEEYDYVGEFINGLSWAKRKSHGWVLIDKHNIEIANQTFDYDDMKSVNTSFAFYRKGDKWGVYNIIDKKAHELLYRDVEVFQCNNTIGYFEGKSFVIDSFGQQIENCDHVNNLLNTMVWASPSYQKWVLLNSNGEIINEYSFETVRPCLMRKYLHFLFSDWVVPLRKYDIIWGFSNGFAWVAKDGKFGLIDRRGEEKLPCVYSFEYVRGVVMGLAWVQLNGKEGYIDTLGRQIIPCEYDYISDFENGIAYIVKNKKYGLIDSYGNEIVKPAYERVMYCKDSVIWVMDEAEKWGLIDMKEQKLTPSIFDSVRGFVNGRAWVNLDGKWGVLNLTDYSVSFPLINLEIIYILQDGSSWGKINNKFGLFDAVGNIIFIIDKSVETLVPTNNDKLAIIESAGEWELISTDGKVLTSKKYENIICFENALAQVQLGNMWGLIDTSGKEVLTPMYEAIYHFKNGLVQAGLDEKWDLIDEHGAVINKEKYDNILEIHNKVVIVEKNRKVGLIDRAGNEILPCIYDKYHFRTENKILFYQDIYRESRMGLFFVDSMTWIPAEYEEIAQPNDPWIMVMKNGKWGWVDHKGNIKIPCRYNAATPFNDYSNETDGYATVFQFGLQFRINKKGEMIWR